MACDIDIQGRVPLFALLDSEERAVDDFQHKK
jgi:hypothetical protein